MMDEHESDRRTFLQSLAAWGVSSMAWSAPRARPAETLPNPVGYATISWSQSDFEQGLKTISQLGFKGVQMLGWVSRSYGGAKATPFRAHLQDMKLEPVVLSCSKVNLDPGRPEDETKKYTGYVDFFRELKGHYLQVTDGGDPNREYSADVIRALGARMNDFGKLAEDAGLTLGYHPHFGTIGETREGLGRILDSTDPHYVKLIADVGHLALHGVDPAEVIQTYHERLILTHFKDVRKDAAELVKRDRNLLRHSKHRFSEIGTGIVDFPAILQAFQKVDFRGWVIVELDNYEPRPGGPAESARMNKSALEKLGFQV